MNQQTLTGNWNRLRGKLKERWSMLTDDELDYVEGNVDQLVGLIQQKTGENREAIEHHLDCLEKQCATACEETSKMQDVSEKARAYADRASAQAQEFAHEIAESIQHSTEHAGDAVKHGYERTQHVVKRRPVESLAISFGAGVVTGAVVSFFLCRR